MKQNFKPINDALKNIINKYHLEESYYESMIINDWNKIIINKLVDVIIPMKLEKQILSLKVKSEAWEKELNSKKQDLIKMINAQVEPYEIIDINFI